MTCMTYILYYIKHEYVKLIVIIQYIRNTPCSMGLAYLPTFGQWTWINSIKRVTIYIYIYKCNYASPGQVVSGQNLEPQILVG